jgi:nitrate/TMAO reductase-like tetraheme cytochrome c subunit
MSGGVLDIVKALSVIIFILNFGLLIYILRNKDILNTKVKKAVFPALMVLPILMAFLANYHVFETSKTVEACQSCHVMKPFTNDLKNEESMTLAARHYKNNWIPKDQCYGCHKDYGFNGNFKAKTDGYRHLMRYITGTYSEPIEYRGEFNNANCMSCHKTTAAFKAVDMHAPISAQFEDNSVSCLNCHGRAHPTRLQRTPGSEEYDNLISEPNTVNHHQAKQLKSYLKSIEQNSNMAEATK